MAITSSPLRRLTPRPRPASTDAPSRHACDAVRVEPMKLKRICMRDPIRDAIVSRVLDGSYPPGTHLKELSLAREFNVSQAPIREALRELEMLGLVETERYRGTRVRAIDLTELREAYELRALLEEAAVHSGAQWSAQQLAQLDAELDAMRAADPAVAFDTHMQAVLRFHRQVVAMSGNRVFLRSWDSLAWGVRSRIMAKQIGFVPGFVELRAEISAAMRDGERERAARLLRQITDRLLQHLSDIGDTERKADDANARR